MDVYLIPVGTDRYELYCEHIAADNEMSAEAPAGTGWFASMLHRMSAAIARVEHEQQSGVAEAQPEAGSWNDRMKRRMMCWIAEKVAEQRLLWRIRKESDVTLFFPDDLTGDAALATARAMLQREADRHLKWSIIDGGLFVLSGVAMLIPGPNPIAYYFGFRFVGHYLSRRGATHALNDVIWQCQANPQLSRLRQAIPLTAPERAHQVHEVASALHLENLPTFFARVAVPAA